MIRSNQRDFQRDFAKHRDKFEEIEIFNQKGERVGTYTPAILLEQKKAEELAFEARLEKIELWLDDFTAKYPQMKLKP